MDTVGRPANKKYSQHIVRHLEEVPQGPNDMFLDCELDEEVGKVHHRDETCATNCRQNPVKLVVQQTGSAVELLEMCTDLHDHSKVMVNVASVLDSR